MKLMKTTKNKKHDNYGILKMKRKERKENK